MDKHALPKEESGSSFAGFGVDSSGEGLLHAVVNEVAPASTPLDWEEAIENQLSSIAIPTSLVCVQFVSELIDFTETSSAIAVQHSPTPHLSLAEPDIGPDGAAPFPPTPATTTHGTAPLQFSYSRFLVSAAQHHTFSGVFFDFCMPKSFTRP